MKSNHSIQPFDLDTPLVKFTDEEGSVSEFSPRDACEGIFVAGSNGAGKSSAVAKLYAEKFIKAGYGGIVLSVKSERKTWEDYCKKYDALDRLIIVEPGGKHSFNFLDYEYATNDGSIPYTENIYQLLHTVINAGQEKQGSKSDDPFWSDSLESLIVHAIDLCYLAYGSLSIENLYNIVLAAPKSESSGERNSKNSFAIAFEKAQDNVQKKILEFEKSLLPEQKNLFADKYRYEEEILKAVPEASLLKSIDQFFIENYRLLSSKTRSIVDFSFSTFLSRFLREPIRSLFCNCKTTFQPEDCFNDGKIILLDIPVKKYHKIARDAQILFKLIFQRAAEKRLVDENTPPCFIWSDEGHALLHELDSDFQATARSSRVSTILITQNLPGLYANMGGAKAEYRVKALLATLGTKFFCSNSDVDTNKFASDLIGEGYIEDESSTATMAGDFSSSRTKSYKLERMVRPEQFSGLKSGAKKNKFLVEAYMHRQNHLFPDGLTFRKITFSQQ